jgi:ATP-dependent Lon protease
MSKKRRNSETDYDLFYAEKIIEKSKYDTYFKKLSHNEKITVIDKEIEIYNYGINEIPLRYKIMNSHLPIATKLLIFNKLDEFENISPENMEYSKINKWIQGLSLIPFDNYIKIGITIEDGSDKINNYLHSAYKILNSTIYGQTSVKNKLMQILAQWISNPNSTNQILALEGPAGVGKTSLIKEGLSKIVNRPFSFYALGGANDVSILEGHSYTYEGGTWGRIVEILMESKAMNPIIFFDELDKISKTIKGNEITGLLTHITDPVQNNVYQDKYYSGINLDLSKAMFVFSFNEMDKINPILLNRLTIIKFEEYNLNDKIAIMKDYMLPKIIKNIGLKEEDVLFNNDIIKYVIKKYVEKEEGLRNSKSTFENILLKINLLKLVDSKSELFIKKKEFTFPLQLTESIIDYLQTNYF